MRDKTILTSALFAKQPETDSWETVSLPHTWNALDGQDGGADYYRGVCAYRLALPEPKEGTRRYLQFEGANHIAQVFADGELLGRHEGGFSTFRVDVTAAMEQGCREVRVEVDNDAPDVYPQQADFTFFGGLYRAVTYIEVDRTHFDLAKSGTDGVFVTPAADGALRVDAFTAGARKGDEVVCTVVAPDGGEVCALRAKAAVLSAAFEQMGGGGMSAKSMKNMMGMLGAMPLEQIIKLAGKRIPAGAMAHLNGQLTKIKKD